jgi:hypothetical protein
MLAYLEGTPEGSGALFAREGTLAACRAPARGRREERSMAAEGSAARRPMRGAVHR